MAFISTLIHQSEEVSELYWLDFYIGEPQGDPAHGLCLSIAEIKKLHEQLAEVIEKDG
jgi:hypothetical protein